MKFLANLFGMFTGASSEWRKLYESQRVLVADLTVSVEALRKKVDDCHDERSLLKRQVNALTETVEGLNLRLAKMGA